MVRTLGRSMGWWKVGFPRMESWERLAVESCEIGLGVGRDIVHYPAFEPIVAGPNDLPSFSDGKTSFYWRKSLLYDQNSVVTEQDFRTW